TEGVWNSIVKRPRANTRPSVCGCRHSRAKRCMNSKRVRALVVDDEPAMRRALRATLSACGFAIEEARSGEEAIELLAQMSVGLVLLDCNMPGMGGVEACRRIRALAPNAGIVMITIRDTEDDKIEALEAGADDYVTKPFLV